MRKRIKYVTVSIPEGIAKDIDKLIEELEYWPSRGAFVREACMEKIWAERRKLKELRANPHTRLTRLKGVLMARNSESKTCDDILNEFFDFYKAGAS